MALNDAGITAFLAGLDPAIDTGARRGAGFVKDLSQQLAPEDRGDLKRSHRVEPGEKPGAYRVIAGGGDTGVNYAHIVELGDPDNPNYPAQPYMGPAADAIDVALEIAEDVIALAERSRVR